MSGRQHTTSDSVSTSDEQENYSNAVDYLLAMFPPEISGKSTQEDGVVEVGPIEVKIEPEDADVLAAKQNGNESKEADGANEEELRFDPDLGTIYGFTELNVSFMLKNVRLFSPELNIILNFN